MYGIGIDLYYGLHKFKLDILINLFYRYNIILKQSLFLSLGESESFTSIVLNPKPFPLESFLKRIFAFFVEILAFI